MRRNSFARISIVGILIQLIICMPAAAANLKASATQRISGVVKDALLSCYELACENTPLQGSRLVVEEVPVVIFCPSCRTQCPLSSVQLFCCPECGTPCSEIVQGKELEVVALEIQECAPNPV